MMLRKGLFVVCLSLAGAALAACGMTSADDAAEGKDRVVKAPLKEGDGCTLTQGYWKNHEKRWPVDELTIGGVTYDKQELLDLFDTSPEGDKSLILAHQLIAALLNVARGASDAAIADTLESAEAWMEAHNDGDGLPYGIREGEAAEEAVALSEALADFNEGKDGPGHCDDRPSTGSGKPGGSSGSGDPGGSGITGSGDPGGGCDPSDPGGSGSTGSGDPGGSGSTGSGDPGSTCATPCSADPANACGSGSFCYSGCCRPVPH